MKLISWNCKMAFRTKFDQLPIGDILVVPECESLEKLPQDLFDLYPNHLWFGKNKNKGIGLFANSNCTLKLLDCYEPSHEYVIPLGVTHEQHNFSLFGIWSQVNGNYTNNLHNAISEYSELLSDNSILIGDFNSNKIWDNRPSLGNHSKTVALLDEHKITSAYHDYFLEKQGKEKRHTFFMYHHEDKPYHIDYCFLSKGYNILDFNVGIYDKWKNFSDHMPIIIDLSNE